MMPFIQAVYLDLWSCGDVQLLTLYVRMELLPYPYDLLQLKMEFNQNSVLNDTKWPIYDTNIISKGPKIT